MTLSLGPAHTNRASSTESVPKRKAQSEPEAPAPFEPAPLPVVSVADGDISPEQAAILRLMDTQSPVQADDLIDLSGLPTRQVLADLTMLEIGGYVKRFPGKRYTRLAELKDE